MSDVQRKKKPGKRNVHDKTQWKKCRRLWSDCDGQRGREQVEVCIIFMHRVVTAAAAALEGPPKKSPSESENGMVKSRSVVRSA